jgi:hypothetical protein
MPVQVEHARRGRHRDRAGRADGRDARAVNEDCLIFAGGMPGAVDHPHVRERDDRRVHRYESRRALRQRRPLLRARAVQRNGENGHRGRAPGVRILTPHVTPPSIGLSSVSRIRSQFGARIGQTAPSF